MSDKTKKVGELITLGDEKGKYYTQNYWIDASDKSTWESALLFHSTTNVSPFTNDFPSGAFFFKWEFVSVSEHYALRVESAEEGWFADTAMKTSVDIRGKAYTKTFFFKQATERATYEPVGLKHFSTANISPFNFPAGSYFKEWLFTELGVMTSLKVTACEIGYFADFEMKTVKSTRGKAYTKAFYINTSSRSTYESPLIYFAPANTYAMTDNFGSSFSFPSGSYFYDWSFIELGLQCLVIVTAKEIGLFADVEMKIYGTEKGTLYTQSLIFNTGSSPSPADPTGTDLAYLETANKNWNSFPSGSYFKEWTRLQVGAQTILTVTAGTIGMFDSAEMKTELLEQGTRWTYTKYVKNSDRSGWENAFVFRNLSGSPFGNTARYFSMDFTAIGANWKMVIVACTEGLFPEDGIFCEGEKRGMRYWGTIYRLTEEQKAQYSLVLDYEKYANIPPLAFPSGTKILIWDWIPKAELWDLRIECADSGFFTSSGNKKKDDTNTVKKWYDLERFDWLPEWWGATQIKSDTKIQVAGVMKSPIELLYYNINGTPCTVGDYVFLKTAGASTVGTPNFTNAPFSGCTISNMPLALIGVTETITVYKCSFYKSTQGFNENDIEGFRGINGVFTPPAKCTPSTTTAGAWKAYKQEVTPNAMQSTAGIWHHMIFRSALKVPRTGLTWKESQTWTW